MFNRIKKIKIDNEKLPNHIAFIIDGNGRWAKKRGLPRSLGHRAGIETVKTTISDCLDLKIKELSFFCFSTENWNRSKKEVDCLFDLFREFFNTEIDNFKEKNIKFVYAGRTEDLPLDIVEKMEQAKHETLQNSAMTVCLCINYGGRFDIINAVNNIIESKIKKVTEKEFSSFLLTKEISDPDLIIRTSGEQRISNFYLYQMAYSELIFLKSYWPDFNKRELLQCLNDFQHRNRRFGAIKE